MRKPQKLIIRLTVGAMLLVVFYFSWTLLFNGSDTIQLLRPDKPYTSIAQVLQDSRFKGKIIYGDIWGTSCIPCIEEFKNHTQPLKQHYRGRQDVAFLYLCIDSHPGAEYRWKKRIREYNIQGDHVLLTEEQFYMFYDQVTGQPEAAKYIPRYFIADRSGNILIQQARRPSESKALYNQIDSTLNMQ